LVGGSNAAAIVGSLGRGHGGSPVLIGRPFAFWPCVRRGCRVRVQRVSQRRTEIGRPATDRERAGKILIVLTDE